MKDIQDITINLITESFKGDEELLVQFKERAPKFYKVCSMIEELNHDIEFKPNYSVDSKQNGTFEVNFTVGLSNGSIIKGYLNSNGICKIKPNNFILNDDTIEYLTGLNNILKNFEKHAW